MKNILSYKQPVTGKDIKDWVNLNLTNKRNRRHQYIAKRLRRYVEGDHAIQPIKDDKLYDVIFIDLWRSGSRPNWVVIDARHNVK